MGKILLADAELEYQTALLRASLPEDGLQCCAEGERVLEQLEESTPDMLILDMKLSDVDGTWVLRRAAKANLLPTTIVTGRFFSSYLVNLLGQYGVAAVIPKPYRPECMLELMEDLRSTAPIQESNPSDWISSTLISLGVLTNQRGFRYLRDGIAEKARDSSIQMTKCLYPAIAKRYEITTTAVEKAIRTAIQTAYRRRNPNQWKRYFPTDHTGEIPQPTNGYFITRLAESYPRKSERS